MKEKLRIDCCFIIYSGCLVMHFEVPKAKKFKEFGGEHVMILISILTALALEAVVEKIHHDHLAREAAGQIDDKTFIQRFQSEWHTAVNLSVQSPSLRREAWEAAAASQAVTWMPHTLFEKYANTYAEMRHVSALFNGGTINFLDGPHAQDVFSNVQLGIGFPRDIFRTVTQMINVYSSLDGNLQSLQRDLDNVVAAPQHGQTG